MVRNEHNGNTIGIETYMNAHRDLMNARRDLWMKTKNHSGTAVKGFKKSEYERDFMAVPSIKKIRRYLC